MDIEKARFNMIEQQIRPWEVLDQSVLDLLAIVKREEFVPPAYRLLAFADMEIPLRIPHEGAFHDSGEFMFAPKVEARFLQEIALRAHEQVLEIGTGSGYMAALAAHKAHHVLTVEIDAHLARFATDNLARAGVRNVKVEVGDAALGWPARAPYDAIIVSGGLPALPPALLEQLKIGGRLIAIVGEAPAMSAQIVTRVTESGYDTVPLFETVVKPLRNAWRPPRFRF
ncbi:MAG: protein-L-isoaspartate O-methyltransferase [Burkholderiaceae bacterium]|nr:protein-L-isoaspartate O-methyltransferase [Burkholderiaceae bacterium]MCX8004456.1 protein-L-isoaspartate O-methyltransferase [Burkholderiaceae bacterium]